MWSKIGFFGGGRTTEESTGALSRAIRGERTRCTEAAEMMISDEMRFDWADIASGDFFVCACVCERGREGGRFNLRRRRRKSGGMCEMQLIVLSEMRSNKLILLKLKMKEFGRS